MINLATWVGPTAMAGVLGMGMWVGGISNDVDRLMSMEADVKDNKEILIALVCKLVPEKCPVEIK